MKTIEYRVHFTGATSYGHTFMGASSFAPEIVRVQARDINSGFPKALKLANERLGNGLRREIGSVEFWQVV